VGATFENTIAQAASRPNPAAIQASGRRPAAIKRMSVSIAATKRHKIQNELCVICGNLAHMENVETAAQFAHENLPRRGRRPRGGRTPERRPGTAGRVRPRATHGADPADRIDDLFT
jgi:hypothetical protein